MSRRGNTSSGSSREPVLGYPRAVRVGSHAFVAGTTAGPAEGADTAARAREIFGRAGSGSDSVSAVHGEVFRDIFPVTTAVEVGTLVAACLLVEMKADAVPQ
ncbi:RidA family protein [Streptomyces sp. NPDC001880]